MAAVRYRQIDFPPKALPTVIVWSLLKIDWFIENSKHSWNGARVNSRFSTAFEWTFELRYSKFLRAGGIAIVRLFENRATITKITRRTCSFWFPKDFEENAIRVLCSITSFRRQFIWIPSNVRGRFQEQFNSVGTVARYCYWKYLFDNPALHVTRKMGSIE